MFKNKACWDEELVSFRRSSESDILLDSIDHINFRIDAGEASTAAPLGPLLGQFQIPLSEFCDSFNADSDLYFPDYELRVRVRKDPLDFYYEIFTPRWAFFLDSCFAQYGFDLDELNYPYRALSVEDAWFLVKLYSEINDFSYFKSARIFFGFLSSYIIYIGEISMSSNLANDKECVNSSTLYIIISWYI